MVPVSFDFAVAVVVTVSDPTFAVAVAVAARTALAVLGVFGLVRAAPGAERFCELHYPLANDKKITGEYQEPHDGIEQVPRIDSIVGEVCKI